MNTIDDALEEAKAKLAAAQEMSGLPTAGQLQWVMAYAAIAQAEQTKRVADALESISESVDRAAIY